MLNSEIPRPTAADAADRANRQCMRRTVHICCGRGEHDRDMQLFGKRRRRLLCSCRTHTAPQEENRALCPIHSTGDLCQLL